MRVLKIVPLAALTVVFGLVACDAGTEELDTTPAEESLADEPLDIEPTTGVEAIAFADLDEDGDSELDANEMDEWVERFRANRGPDASGDVRADEISTVLFVAWDTDDDDVLTEAEWSGGIEAFYDDVDYGAWADWDLDGDSELDANEVTEGFERANLYDHVDGDADALIDDEELADWFVDVLDVNDDDVVDRTEYEATADWNIG